MNATVTRHSFFVSEDDHGLPYVDDQEDPDGGWVKYDDIKHLLHPEPEADVRCSCPCHLTGNLCEQCCDGGSAVNRGAEPT